MPPQVQLLSAICKGLGKTMQTIALICTDDTGAGVLASPEEPDMRYDDMTLIGRHVLESSDTQF